MRDAGHVSHHHTQNFGICQGCPLSPFLLVMLMTVLMHDAKRMLRSSPGYSEKEQYQIQELLYADDTLLVHADPATIQLYMECVRAAGRNYGLSLNWQKLEHMPIRCNA